MPAKKLDKGCHLAADSTSVKYLPVRGGELSCVGVVTSQ